MGSRSAKLISCILPDDGTERHLLHWLRDLGIKRANSVYCRGHSVLREAKARRGRLPGPELVRLVTIVVEDAAADGLFERIYEQAAIHRPGGGALFMTPLTFATPFVLPQGVTDENGARGE
jgi:nitrogen regulatory protein PII